MRVLKKVSDDALEALSLADDGDENAGSSQEYWYDVKVATVGRRRYMSIQLLDDCYLMYVDLTKEPVTDALSYLHNPTVLAAVRKRIGKDNYIRLHTSLCNGKVSSDFCKDHPTTKVLIVEHEDMRMVSIIKFDNIKDAKRFVNNDTDEAFHAKYPECVGKWRNCDHYYI